MRSFLSMNFIMRIHSWIDQSNRSGETWSRRISTNTKFSRQEWSSVSIDSTTCLIARAGCSMTGRHRKSVINAFHFEEQLGSSLIWKHSTESDTVILQRRFKLESPRSEKILLCHRLNVCRMPPRLENRILRLLDPSSSHHVRIGTFSRN